ncbi:unnamed protein product [Amoebophrya sp. A120]|nr:unnamed protein product [Amoebophrya sp. A120]|eukprot:GSA120T00021519001.1
MSSSSGSGDDPAKPPDVPPQHGATGVGGSAAGGGTSSASSTSTSQQSPAAPTDSNYNPEGAAPGAAQPQRGGGGAPPAPTMYGYGGNPYGIAGNSGVMQNGGVGGSGASDANNPYMQQQPGMAPGTAPNAQAKLPVREDMVKQALTFLNHDTVRKTASESQKRTFLLQKGLTEEEITEALGRVGTWTGAAGAPTAPGGASASSSSNPKVVYPPPAYLYQDNDDSSVLRTFLQVSGALSIGALAYRWLQKNETWIQERTGVSLGIGPSPLESGLEGADFEQGGAGLLVKQTMDKQADEISQLKGVVEELKQSNRELQEDLARQNGQLMQTMSQLMEKTQQLQSTATASSKVGNKDDPLQSEKIADSVVAKLDVERLAEVVAAKLDTNASLMAKRFDTPSATPSHATDVAQQAPGDPTTPAAVSHLKEQQPASSSSTSTPAAVKTTSIATPGSGNEKDGKTSEESAAPATSSKPGLDLPAEDITKWKGEMKRLLLKLVKACETKQDASKTLNMLYLVMENLRKHPGQDKYRKVNTASSRFKERLGNKIAASEILLLLGFEKKGQNFAYGLDKAQQEEVARTNTLPIQPDVCPVVLAVDVVSESLHSIDSFWTEAQASGQEATVGEAQPVDPAKDAAAARSKSTGTSAGNGAGTAVRGGPQIRDLLAEEEQAAANGKE